MLRFALFALAVAASAQIPEVAGAAVDAFTLRWIEVRPGEGPAAEAGQRYTVHYTGWLRDGTKFDSSVDRKEPFEFVQGRRNVIAGWEAGFAGMRVGGKRRLIIPWQMAYGEKGSGTVIPPRADLIFDVELLGVKEVAPVPAALDLLVPLKELRRKVVALAQAVPEDKYAARPVPAVRTFGEVMLHIALGNALMFDIGTNALEGEALKKRIAENAARPVPAKDELIRLLEDSFTPIEKYLDTARAGVLAQDVTFFGTPLNRRGVLVYLNTHIAEHMGQAIAYARLNNIRPPWSTE